MDVVVPDLGDFTDVEVIEILVKPGDVVAAEDPLITLETEKAAMDVPSPAAGTVTELRVELGSKVSAGDEILVLEEAEAVTADVPEAAQKTRQASADRSAQTSTEAAETETAATPTPPAAPRSAEPSATDGGPRPAVAASGRQAAPRYGVASAPQQPARAPHAVDEAGFSRAHASPSVRKLARELGVNLVRVSGSGRKGRVTANDVKLFVKSLMQGDSGGGSALPEIPAVDFAKFGPVETEPLSRIQRISGPRLHASWVNVPHVTQHDEADITAIEEIRQKLKDAAAERGIRLTPLAFVLRACALTLAEFPTFRSSLDRDGKSLVVKHYTHIGFAADTPGGLVVPVIRDADRMDIYELAAALSDLSGRAREGTLKADEMQGGVFTVSSLGGIGGTYFTPIINAPEVAILGVSRNYMKPVYQDGGFVPRLVLPLSLSYDHRVIDGARAARFITCLSSILGDVDRIIEAIP